MPVSLTSAGLDRSYRDTIHLPSGSTYTLAEFLRLYLPEQADRLIDGDHLHPGFVVLIDGRNATQIGELEAIIRDGTDLVIATHSVGG